MTNKHLEFFKLLLQRKKEELLNNSNSVFQQITDNNNRPSDEGDHAAEEVRQYLNCTINSRDRKCLLEIERAFARIEQGDFGHCEECGVGIPIERLKVQPYCSLCIDCMEDMELEQRRPA
jgi:DnaK suppressor protein